MRRRTGASLALALVLASGAACELVAGIQDITLVAAVDDAGSDAPAAPDAPAASDAGADASAPTSFCATRAPSPLFCDDFDGDEAVGARWTIAEVSPPSTLAKTKNAVSAPFGLESHTAASAGGGTRALLRRAYEASPRGAVLAFDARVDPTCVVASTGAFFLLAKIELAVDEHTVGLLMRSDGLLAEEYVKDGGVFNRRSLTRGLGAAFTRVTLDVATPPSGPATVSVAFDGETVLVPTPIDPLVSAGGRITVGLEGNGNIPACNVDYDDVTLDLH